MMASFGSRESLRIMRNGQRVPVVAFFGTKGGVGKTTIAKRFAELVASSPAQPNVLAMDLDVDHRGLTVTLGGRLPMDCMTVHDYIAGKRTQIDEAVDVTSQMERRAETNGTGRLYLLPASTPDSAEIFRAIADIDYGQLLSILHDVVDSAVQRYDLSCVVVDCGPVINPYTAAAAHLADRAFIIGQNEPISFSSLGSYSQRIKEMYPDFTTAKMKIVINKVRGWEQLEERMLTTDVFATIPFSIDVVDISEGIENVDQMRLMLFENNIVEIVRNTFEGDHPELVPPNAAVVPPEWQRLVDEADRLPNAPGVRRTRFMRLLAAVGLVMLIAGIVLYYTGRQTRLELEAKAAAAAQDPGVPPPPAPSQAKENIGLVTCVAGLVVLCWGLVIVRKYGRYDKAIQNLRTKGTPWLMREMERSSSSRAVLDGLRRSM